jgi:hypothetical protein
MITPDLAWLFIQKAQGRHLRDATMTGWMLRDLYKCDTVYQQPIDDAAEQSSNVSGTSSEQGLLFAHVDNMVAATVPTDPRITISARRKTLAGAAKARQRVVNAEFERLRVKRFVRKAMTKAAVYPRHITRLTWDTAARAPKLTEIPFNRVIFDLEATTNDDIKWICEVVVISEGAWNAKIQTRNGRRYVYDRARLAESVHPGQFPAYLEDAADIEKRDFRSAQKWVVVYQFWDFVGGQFMEFVDTFREEPILRVALPYKKLRNPFYILSLNDDLDSMRGFSDGQVVQRPLNRAAELATLANEFARASITHPIMDESAVDSPDDTARQFAEVKGPRDVVRLRLAAGKSIRDVMEWRPTPTLNPAFQAVSEANRADVMFRLGMSEYSRGVTGTGNVATEFALAQAADKTRRGFKMDTLNGLIQWIACSILLLMQEYMGADETYPVGTEEGDEEVYEEVSRQAMGFDADIDDMMIFKTRTHSGLDDNPAMLLQNVMTAMKALMGNPNVNQAELMRWIIGLLDAPPRLFQAAPPAPPPGAPGMPGMPPGGPGAPPGPMPSISPTGGEPAPGVPSIPTPALAGMAGGPGHPAPKVA